MTPAKTARHIGIPREKVKRNHDSALEKLKYAIGSNQPAAPKLSHYVFGKAPVCVAQYLNGPDEL